VKDVWKFIGARHSRSFSEDEHGKLLGQIEQLKTALEHEQMIRRRKIEYDAVAEKVNAFPTREELQQ
jgi:THO complex subunit 7